jgi:hypothetical protein
MYMFLTSKICFISESGGIHVEGWVWLSGTVSPLVFSAYLHRSKENNV